MNAARLDDGASSNERATASGRRPSTPDGGHLVVESLCVPVPEESVVPVELPVESLW